MLCDQVDQADEIFQHESRDNGLFLSVDPSNGLLGMAQLLQAHSDGPNLILHEEGQ
jgi:hypothetical protein